MSTVALRSLVKRYGTLNAVDDVSLDVPEGQLVALLGPSGCGKTTTLRMIGGFVETDAGSILIGGSDVTRLPPAKRNIGFGFQSYALFPHMSVARNVAFGLEMRRLPRAEIADPRRPGPRPGPTRRDGRPAAQAALRGAATACLARPCARDRAVGAAPRRAALQPRRPVAR